MKVLLITSFTIILSSIVVGQPDLIHTKSFSKKLNKFKLYYYEATEGWLHPVPIRTKEYGKFDIALESSNQDIEIRYQFKDASHPQAISNHPQLDLYQYVANLATNNQSENIIISEIHPEVLDTVFNADWGLYADFTPKISLSPTRHKCRLLAIYKGNASLIYSMIFYNDEIPDYFDLPISFKEEEGDLLTN